MPDKTIEVQGVNELVSNISKVLDDLESQLKIGVDKAMKNTAEDIQITFKGGSSPGFQDRTGALRASIRGGLDDTAQEIVGFVGAGDDTIGSDGKPTREYIKRIEFGEFSRAGKTSFLRAGVQKSQRQIEAIIKEEINLEKII